MQKAPRKSTNRDRMNSARSRRWLWIFLLVAIPALVGFGLFSIGRRGEPRYQGKPISYWLTLASDPSSITTSSSNQKKSDFQEAQDAIVKIGTAALPFVTSSISFSEPVWLRSYRQVVNKLPSSW